MTPIRKSALAVATLAAALPITASGQSAEYMAQDCRNSGQIFFQDFEARTEASYEGRRTDGTHAVNGTIYLETRSESFQCSYGADGATMVGFVAEGRDWPGFARGEGSPYMDRAESGADGGDVAAEGGPVTVRFAPGSTTASMAGELGPGDAVQYVLRAREGQFLSVVVTPTAGELDYQIMNPDDSRLLDMIGSDRPYRGQLWQSGDHVVEVVNRTAGRASYRVSFAIE